MDIFEFGIKMEKDGEAYYRELAGRCDDTGLKTILGMLADSEVKHQEVLARMREDADPGLAESRLLDGVSNVFESIKSEGGDHDLDTSQVEAYRKAQELEHQSEAFYTEKAGETDVDLHRDLFTRMAAEEKEHALILDDIISFITEPDRFIADAEWGHHEA